MIILLASLNLAANENNASFGCLLSNDEDKLSIIVKQLNTTFTNNIPEENAEQMGWFLK